VYLHKPMLVVPLRRQIEQVLNARYLEAEGYGLGAEVLDAARIGAFVERLPDFARKLARYSQDGNRDLLSMVERQLAAAVASGASDSADDAD
jgi:UDP:flavonoid glycosyltransferase YjiC (YdhE family)